MGEPPRAQLHLPRDLRHNTVCVKAIASKLLLSSAFLQFCQYMKWCSRDFFVLRKSYQESAFCSEIGGTMKSGIRPESSPDGPRRAALGMMADEACRSRGRRLQAGVQFGGLLELLSGLGPFSLARQGNRQLIVRYGVVW